MKNYITRVISTTATVAVLALSAGQASAAASSLSINPASGTYNKNSAFSVGIVETGDSVNVVTVNLSYDATKLACNGVGGGAFAGEIVATCSGGKVQISRYVTPGQPALNGAQVVGTLNFTALAGSGSTSLAFGTSQVASNGANTLGSSTGATYGFATPATTGGSGSGTPTTTTYLNPAASTATTKVTQASSTSAAPTATATETKPSVLSDAQKPKEEKKQTVASTTSVAKKSNVGANIAKLIGLVAIAAGIVVAQRYRAYQLASSNAAPAAAAVATKKKPAAKKKTSTKKKPTARKK